MSEQHISFQTFHEVAHYEELGALVQPIIACITNAFGHEMPSDEVEGAMNGYLLVVATTFSQAVVGFASLAKSTVAEYTKGHLDDEYQPEDPRFSFSAATVDNSYHGQGIYKQLNRQRLAAVIAAQAPLLTTTTQNPRVEKGLVSALEESLAAGQLAAYRLQRTYLPSYYGRRLTKYPLKTANTDFELLNLEVGDAYSLAFHLSYPNGK